MAVESKVLSQARTNKQETKVQLFHLLVYFHWQGREVVTGSSRITIVPLMMFWTYDELGKGAL